MNESNSPSSRIESPNPLLIKHRFVERITSRTLRTESVSGERDHVEHIDSL